VMSCYILVNLLSMFILCIFIFCFFVCYEIYVFLVSLQVCDSTLFFLLWFTFLKKLCYDLLLLSFKVDKFSYFFILVPRMKY
jgi:hypothetical protein